MTRVFRHLKRNTEYEYIGAATSQSRFPGMEMIEMVVYRSLTDGSLWVRPRHEFWDGRFEEIQTNEAAQ